MEEAFKKFRPADVFTVLGVAIVVAGIVWAVPFLARRAAAGDLAGVPVRVSSGMVREIDVAVGHGGGGGMHNAVTLDFAGRKAFYILPETSRWIPVVGESVSVRYRVGKNSGVAQIDSVTPADSGAKWAPPLRR